MPVAEGNNMDGQVIRNQNHTKNWLLLNTENETSGYQVTIYSHQGNNRPASEVVVR